MAEGNIDRPHSYFYGYLTCDSTGEFPVTIEPEWTGQLAIIARNTATGALYALHYRLGPKTFAIDSVLSGSSPTIGQSIGVWYPI